MSSRLEAAIRHLTSEQLEKLTRDVEELAAENTRRDRASEFKWSFRWAGALKDAGFESATAAQKLANEERIRLLLKGLPK